MTGSSHTSSVVDDPRYREHLSDKPFEATLLHLVKTIEAAGLSIFARIDHAAAARTVGLTMPPTVVLIYGNPRGGTPIMLAHPPAALDLPLRVLVREEADGRVFVGYHPIAQTLQEAGVPADIAARLAPAQAFLSMGDKR